MINLIIGLQAETEVKKEGKVKAERVIQFSFKEIKV